MNPELAKPVTAAKILVQHRSSAMVAAEYKINRKGRLFRRPLIGECA
jgi:hypothetical protein